MRIAGYTYDADNFCAACVVKLVRRVLIARYGFSVGGFTAEEFLDNAANRLGIDRQDEDTFVSDDFPKVIFATQIEGYEWCTFCDSSLR